MKRLSLSLLSVLFIVSTSFAEDYKYIKGYKFLDCLNNSWSPAYCFNRATKEKIGVSSVLGTHWWVEKQNRHVIKSGPYAEDPKARRKFYETAGFKCSCDPEVFGRGNCCVFYTHITEDGKRVYPVK